MKVWLGRVWDPQAGSRTMVDFTRPVKITVNRAAYGREHLIAPSLATMMEDLYSRGDRQRLFWAFEELTNLP
jgi:hypothetical protein